MARLHVTCAACGSTEQVTNGVYGLLCERCWEQRVSAGKRTPPRVPRPRVVKRRATPQARLPGL